MNLNLIRIADLAAGYIFVNKFLSQTLSRIFSSFNSFSKLIWPGESTFLNVNATQPSYILVHGGDAAAKNSIMKQIVDVWVKLELPVMVVSPELKSVSSHSDVDFYQFKTITGTFSISY